MKGSTIIVLLGVVAMVSMFSAQPFGEFMLFKRYVLLSKDISYCHLIKLFVLEV